MALDRMAHPLAAARELVMGGRAMWSEADIGMQVGDHVFSRAISVIVTEEGWEAGGARKAECVKGCV
jgi:hypothetical protein